jgi:serine/threonine protein kinase
VDEKLTVKVADFGLTKLLKREDKKLETDPHGTPAYMAPEGTVISISSSSFLSVC